MDERGRVARGRDIGESPSELGQTDLGHVGEGKRKSLCFSILCL